MKKILIIGNTGQVGWELQRALAPVGNVVGVDYPDIDLTNLDATRDYVREVQPEVIVNAAAYTDVDRAEKALNNAHSINAVAPAMLAEEARRLKIPLFHYSTDFVYDGTKGSDYVETDPTNPINAYGQTKLDGDLAIEEADTASIIMRTAWVYSTRRPCFVTKVMSWARKFSELRIVTDQVGCPTWSRMLAEVTAKIIAMGEGDLYGWVKERSGVYHVAGDGGASRFEWAQAILDLDPKKEEHWAKEIQPAVSSEFPTPAKRPAYSVLNCDKFENTFSLRLPPWREALKMAIEEMQGQTGA